MIKELNMDEMIVLENIRALDAELDELRTSVKHWVYTGECSVAATELHQKLEGAFELVVMATKIDAYHVRPRNYILRVMATCMAEKFSAIQTCFHYVKTGDKSEKARKAFSDMMAAC